VFEFQQAILVAGGLQERVIAIVALGEFQVPFGAALVAAAWAEALSAGSVQDWQAAPVPALAFQQQQAHGSAQCSGAFAQALQDGLDFLFAADDIVQHQQMRLPRLPTGPVRGEALEFRGVQQSGPPVPLLRPEDQLIAEPAFALAADAGDLHPQEGLVRQQECAQLFHGSAATEQFDGTGIVADQTAFGAWRVAECGILALWFAQPCRQQGREQCEHCRQQCEHCRQGGDGDHESFVLAAELVQPVYQIRQFVRHQTCPSVCRL
jgi:hypothetical protein